MQYHNPKLNLADWLPTLWAQTSCRDRPGSHHGRLARGDAAKISAYGQTLRYGLALLLVACTVSYYGSWIVQGERIFPGHMPLELCDFALWLVIATLMTLKPVIYDVVYYWALIGTAMAVVTPNLTHPSLFMEIQFFADHGFIVVAVLYLAWSGQLRPRPGSSGNRCSR